MTTRSLTLIALCLTAFLAQPAGAEPAFIAGRQEGLALLQKGRHAEAAAFFVKLAESAAKPEQKADALRHAALATVRDKRFDEALLLAEQIPLKPESLFAKVQIYLEARKWAEVLQAAEMLDEATWPDGLIYDTFMARARAHSALGETAEAERDALASMKHTLSKNNLATAWHFIAQDAQRSGKGPDKALAAYAEIIRLQASGGGWQRALSERARLLSSLGKHEAALADLGELEKVTRNDPHWVCTALIGYGEVHRAMGDKAKARESLEKAAKVPGAPAVLVEEAKKRLEEIQP
ncbi:MAG: MalT-like region [Candidatus Hydrogenedentota bacterium]